MNELISVIIPVYNVEHYLRQCVDSVLTQTYTKLEIILVDDGSPDASPTICDEYAQKDKRIKVIHKENGGLSSARNAGLDAATGDFIYFLDSDDYIGENTLIDLYQAIKKNSKIAISIGYFTAISNNEVHKPFRLDWFFKEPEIINSKNYAFKILSEQINFAATAKLYRYELIQNVRFQLNKKNEDTLFAVDLIPLIETNHFYCINIPNYAYYYRQHDGSICHDAIDPLEKHSINNLEVIINKYADRIDLVHLLRKRQYELSVKFLSNLLKLNNWKLFKENQILIKNIPNRFIIKSHNFVYFIYFALLKYTPRLLKMYTQCRNIFSKYQI